MSRFNGGVKADRLYSHRVSRFVEFKVLINKDL